MANHLAKLPSDESVRVEDYLNDKIQTAADLESLNSLLSTLKSQQDLQRKQLAEAEEVLKKATKTSNDHADAVRKQAEAFRGQQADIDRRLLIVTQSDRSDEAVQKFEASMEKLRRLDVSKRYMQLMKEVNGLSAKGLKAISISPRDALKPYTRLRNIALALKEAQPAAEGAAPHLVAYAEKVALSLGDQIKKDFANSFQKSLQDMKWPGKDLILTDQVVKQWTEGVELLLELQEPELLDINKKREGTKAVAPVVLSPLELMAHPLALRFRYHFSGDKPTNRLDKPEYFLSHVIDLIGTYDAFVKAYLQPILNERARTAGSDLDWIYLDGTSSFITALLPMLRQKITTSLPQIADHPQLLSHFMHELMDFDAELRDVWGYTQDPLAEEPWKGLTWEVLVQQDWFGKWLQVEKDFALSRYQDIIDTPDSGHIDYDGVEPAATKPTKAAIRVNDLLETITERYRPLSSFSQKLRFLIDIQIAIFDQFHERLRSGLEAYLTMTSTIGRTVQGSAGRDDQTNLDGVAGLERLCRVFGSAEYLEKKMQDWSDDVFFLELWWELQERVKQNTKSGRPVAGPMTVSEVAARTSTAVSANGDGSATDGALFDETTLAYRRLRLRSESVIVSTLTSNLQSALKAFSRVSTWASLSGTSSVNAEYPLPPTSDLVPACRTLSTNVTFLARVLGLAPLKRISRQLLLSLQSYFWDNVLMRHTFSTAGAAQLRSDFENICGVIEMAVNQHSPGTGIGTQDFAVTITRKMREGLMILNLKIARGDSAGDAAAEGEPSDGALGLWEVERRLFESNESARNVLSQLGCDTVSEAEARGVLERRVEARS